MVLKYNKAKPFEKLKRGFCSRTFAFIFLLAVIVLTNTGCAKLWSAISYFTKNTPSSFSLRDPSGLALTNYSHQVAVNASIQTENAITKWCLSETQTLAPASATAVCNGGQGASQGWFTSLPTSFNLSAGDGLKTVYLWAADNKNNVITVSSLSTTIILDTTLPTIALSSPLGGETYGGNTSQTITWTASDLHMKSIKLEYSGDSGATWNLISASVPNTGSFAWHTPGLDNVNCRIRATAVDDAGNNSAPSASTSDLTLATTAPVLTLLTPVASGIVQGNNSYEITWAASSIAFGNTPISLRSSYDGGVTWVTVTGGVANAPSTFSWTIPNLTNTTTALIEITATDLAGHTTVISSGNFTIDSQAPTLTAGNFTIDGGLGLSTTNNYVTISLKGADNLTNITYVCFKSNSSSQPLITDSCWTAVNTIGATPSTNLTLTNVPYLVGFVENATYTVYAWLHDAAGNISALTAGGGGTTGQDKGTITYAPGSPPVLINVISSSTATPSTPATQSDLTAAVGSNVYVQWKISAAVNGLGATPISIYYTTDDITYTLVATNIANGPSGCTPDANHGGCYLWSNGSPASTYFKIRVVATDNDMQASSSTGTPMNTFPPINFLAGNTDPGTGASAKAAVFMSETAAAYNADPGSLAVAENGTVYFRDIYRGILTVSPSDNIQKILIPVNASNASNFGDGGPASAATLKVPYRITLDFNGNILIWDYDRIRKIDASTHVITTVIGGGASSADNVAPTAVSIANLGSTLDSNNTYPNTNFFALPNGDIYFQSESVGVAPVNGGRVRVYRSAVNQVQSIYFSGTGDFVDPNQDETQCPFQNFGVTFDPSTSILLSALTVAFHNTTGPCPNGFDYAYVNYNLATWASTPVPSTGTYPNRQFPLGGPAVPPSNIQGHDGNLYVVSGPGSSSFLDKYSYSLNTWTAVVGEPGSGGSCVDGTPATSCPVSIEDAYVTAEGKIYFVDRGKIRSVDSNSNIITVMGQALNFGDGGDALSARFNVVNTINILNSGAIDILDRLELRFRQFTVGGSITTIAGNGSASNGTIDTTDLATSAPFLSAAQGVYMDDFRADPATGNIFYAFGGGLEKLSAATGKWSFLVGNGGTDYTVGDGDVGSAISFNFMPPRILGWDGSNLLTVVESRNSGFINNDGALKTYNSANGLQSGIAGLNNGTQDGAFYCSGTNAALSCAVPSEQDNYHPQASYDSYPTPPRWVVSDGTFKLKAVDVTLVNHSNTGNAYDLVGLSNYINSFAYRHDATHNIVYYCATDGILHKSDLIAGTDTPYAWPIPSVKCTGKSLIYSSTRNTLIFPYLENGLYGIAEYLNP